jgi:ABC-2 type transport system ATP-binding protein
MVQRPAVEAIGVSKRYRNREALCGVDLIAQPGQLHGLLGPNGAGKTTLMRELLGLARPDAGTVHLLGCDLSSTRTRIPEGVAGLVEAPAFYPYLSGRKNLELLARLDGKAKSNRNFAVEYVLEQAGLAAQADVSLAAYSAGMRQRLGLASALLRSPQLLVLDEPTSSLDPGGARDVRALARRLANEGTAVVLSSHDMAEVEDLCAVLTIIDRGRVVFSGTVDELRELAPVVHVLRTNDDRTALNVASQRPELKVARAADGFLQMSADVEALDAYVIALGRAGVAIRSLQRRARSLESLFLELTGRADAEDMLRPALCDATDRSTVAPVVS